MPSIEAGLEIKPALAYIIDIELWLSLNNFSAGPNTSNSDLCLTKYTTLTKLCCVESSSFIN